MWVVWQDRELWALMIDLSWPDGASILWSIIIKLWISFTIVMLLLGGLDYMLQLHFYEESLKMSLQEVKQEFKDSEGNPEIKAQRKQRARELLRSLMMQQLRQADVVITNPTHFAVALRYDTTKENSPRIVAKGEDELALHIKKTAASFEIPVVENRELARGLFYGVELDRMIPEEWFKPVAEILALIFKKNGNKKQ